MADDTTMPSALPPPPNPASRSDGEVESPVDAYREKLKGLWLELDDIIELLVKASIAGSEDSLAELREQMRSVRTAIELNARLLGAEECKLWMISGDPRQQPTPEGTE